MMFLGIPVYNCGTSVGHLVGTIESLDGYGDMYYDDNLDCLWLIYYGATKLPKARQFYITKMDIEDSVKCQSDFIEVRHTKKCGLR